MAELVGSWLMLTDVAAVTVTVTAEALAWTGATPASAVSTETAKAKRTLKALSRYIADPFLSGTC